MTLERERKEHRDHLEEFKNTLTDYRGMQLGSVTRVSNM